MFGSSTGSPSAYSRHHLSAISLQHHDHYFVEKASVYPTAKATLNLQHSQRCPMSSSALKSRATPTYSHRDRQWLAQSPTLESQSKRTTAHAIGTMPVQTSSCKFPACLSGCPTRMTILCENSLIEHLTKLPKELRDKIYSSLTLPWAPSHPYAKTNANGELVGLARRNATPTYTNRAVRQNCIMRSRNSLKEPSNPVEFFHSSSFDLADATRFADKYGKLDYYKSME